MILCCWSLAACWQQVTPAAAAAAKGAAATGLAAAGAAARAALTALRAQHNLKQQQLLQEGQLVLMMWGRHSHVGSTPTHAARTWHWRHSSSVSSSSSVRALSACRAVDSTAGRVGKVVVVGGGGEWWWRVRTGLVP